jgi:hypothetical protein
MPAVVPSQVVEYITNGASLEVNEVNDLQTSCFSVRPQPLNLR